MNKEKVISESFLKSQFATLKHIIMAHPVKMQERKFVPLIK